MSIASREANNLYSKPNKRTVGRSDLFDFADLRAYQRAAYQRGRTAEPTEAEIEAAAKRIFIFLNGPWQGKHCELSQADGLAIAEAAWETADKQKYEACAEFALQSARKAVTA